MSGDSLARISLICGLLSIGFFFIGVPLGLAGIGLSIASRAGGQPTSATRPPADWCAEAAIITSGAGGALCVLLWSFFHQDLVAPLGAFWAMLSSPAPGR
jgi:hypothetical protein